MPDDPGPGGMCDHCGHFAERHTAERCYFPRPEDNPCTCTGFEWQGNRYASGRDIFDGMPPVPPTGDNQ